jgi:hypothetical protein
LAFGAGTCGVFMHREGGLGGQWALGAKGYDLRIPMVKCESISPRHPPLAHYTLHQNRSPMLCERAAQPRLMVRLDGMPPFRANLLKVDMREAWKGMGLCWMYAQGDEVASHQDAGECAKGL